MRASLRLLSSAALVAVAISACTVKKADNPPSSGPSELALSLQVSATPDRLPQDGASQSVITIFARDGAARPVTNLSVRAEMVVGGQIQDFGSLSARTLVTGGDGRATVTYTAPAPVLGAVGELVTIRLWPLGTDAHASEPRTVGIQLVAPGVVSPPVPGVPDFSIDPNPATQTEHVSFDASDEDLDSQIVRYQWNFGDGSTAQGRIVQHAYDEPGSYIVRLTVTDRTGGIGSRSKTVVVDPSEGPTAEFVFSPDQPDPGQTVFFNASQSAPAAGRTIVKYEWHFGTGSAGVQATGKVVSRVFAVAGTYNVTLKVIDDVGNSDATSQPVGVGLTEEEGP
jgi:PKD repeat protein